MVVPLNFPDFAEETRELVIRFARTALSALAECCAALQVPNLYGVDRGCDEHTRLAEILREQRLTVRNGHHQAVGEVAPDLTVAARGLDGVVEAVEHRDPHCWVLGVQWHPEDSDGSDYSRRALFGALREAAAAYQNACRTG